MKKEYISPKVIAREVKLQNIMAGSVPMSDDPTDKGYGSDAKRGSFEYDEEDF